VWCPQCRSEYREGFTECADCGVALVESLPAHADRQHEDRQHTDRKIVGPFLPDDDLVEIATTNAVDAELIAGRLRGAGIRAAVFGVGTAGDLLALQHVEGSRVMVRRADRDGAERFLAELVDTSAANPPIDEDELASLAEKSKGWSDPSSGAVV
jgi:transcription initiation factor TFIIIB Brf1 subunit/transcription initiation factor TFIIB